MPELPDIEVYLDALRSRILGQPLEGARRGSPFLLRTVEPPLSSLVGRRVEDLRRLGKRIAIGFEGDLFAVLHLMIAGRLHWKPRGAKVPGKVGLAAFDFPTGTLVLTETGSKKRVSLHLVQGEEALEAHDPGGLEVLDADLDAFREALVSESHTLKRALTDPRVFSGIGNAWSDEILHQARLSPFKLTRSLTPEETETLYRACRDVLIEWIDRLRAEVGDRFPEKVTASRKGMAVHGRFGKPCPVCGTPVQRLVYADSEANYCPTCQTGGRLLADRALSQLLKKDWPRTLEELEAKKREAGAG
jgi:formamidopyrimidine-DNA glycosylase